VIPANKTVKSLLAPGSSGIRFRPTSAADSSFRLGMISVTVGTGPASTGLALRGLDQQSLDSDE